MKFNTIKERAKAQLQRLVAQEQGTPGMLSICNAFADLSFGITPTEALRQEFLAEVLIEGSRTIDAWDVRQVAYLLRLFPDAAPGLTGKQVEASYDAAGEWVVRVVA